MDSLFPLLLAQDSEAAEHGIGLLQTVLDGGVPLICLVIAALCGYLFYTQLMKNNALEISFREKIEANAGAQLTGQETLLREMLTRDREATESTSAAIQAVEGYSHSLREQQLAFEALKLALETHGRELRELGDAFRRSRDV